ncbi:hypothetical protein VDR70_008230 [Xanthomonas campestris pv. campestris]|uniref:Uncharacterized protein n=1 Tax=Xanthomonas hortorum pv. vitians TaxID=83224 RepID=A0A6V7FKY3_9XANT|nr:MULTISPECIES: hypothetical protein [Xanthomonas]MCC5053869.1 hypothetical protein [Xanthomonas campestris pv. aberrans]MCF8869944.1 hypothetical protein [Xanthomonas campestris pv. campestris]MDM7685166.1 hypothetical protein [Xanthomonas campestris pv. campestris]MEA0940793.1 hypothetical protein [Xanthomonas campestris pv. campestris]MEA0961523.1 hypothetical protein [Xanthomonas campestris pv. campestris]
MINVPVHQPDVYNIDRAVNDGWSCVGNRFDQKDALAIAGKQAALTGVRHRVCAPGGDVVFDSALASPANASVRLQNEANPAAKALKLDYTAAVDECYRITFDQVHQLAVIGDMANASYEWVIEAHGQVLAHSNDGYGDTSIALRDGLIAFLGLGNVTAAVNLS